MSGANKDKMNLAVELVRKGATMLGEPCPKCGGVKVSYHGKVYCTGHEDLSSVVAAETVSMVTVLAGMRETLLSKLSEATSSLGQEKDSAKQEQLVTLMTKYYDLLEKLSQSQQRP
ncbi:MAG: Sjogren's syndrome/scleroderma autoantigen 1 family protein [Nitrososphaerales archaeon]